RCARSGSSAPRSSRAPRPRVGERASAWHPLCPAGGALRREQYAHNCASLAPVSDAGGCRAPQRARIRIERTIMAKTPSAVRRRGVGKEHWLYIAVIVAVIAGVAVGLLAPEFG